MKMQRKKQDETFKAILYSKMDWIPHREDWASHT